MGVISNWCTVRGVSGPPTSTVRLDKLAEPGRPTGRGPTRLITKVLSASGTWGGKIKIHQSTMEKKGTGLNCDFLKSRRILCQATCILALQEPETGQVPRPCSVRDRQTLSRPGHLHFVEIYSLFKSFHTFYIIQGIPKIIELQLKRGTWVQNGAWDAQRGRSYPDFHRPPRANTALCAARVQRRLNCF